MAVNINIPSAIQKDVTASTDFTSGKLLSSDGTKVTELDPTDLPISDDVQTELDGKASVEAGVPSGGTAAQVLAKVDGTDYNTEWITPSGGGVGQDVIINNDPKINLQKIRSKPTTTVRRIAWVGDSTTEQMFLQSFGGYGKMLREDGTLIDSYTYNELGFVGGPMHNVQSFNAGQNGGIITNFNSDSVAGKNVADIAAFDPDLIIFSYGINDVRLGGTSQSQLISYIETSIQKIRAAMPDVEIILRVPNPLVYDSTNPNSYIDNPTSYAKVQGYSDILRNSYLNFIGYDQGIHVWDCQDQKVSGIFASKVLNFANRGFYLQDDLHPTPNGYISIIRELALLISRFDEIKFPTSNKFKKPWVFDYSESMAYNALQTSNEEPHLYYPRIVEDKRYYNLIMEGLFVEGSPGSGYIDISSNNDFNMIRYAGCLLNGDVITQYNINDTDSGSQGEQIVDGVSSYKRTSPYYDEAGVNLRIVSLDSGYPKAQNKALVVKISRRRPASQKKEQDLNFSAVIYSNDFSAQSLNLNIPRFGVAVVLDVSATSAPTTGGTIDLKKNGVQFATATFANGSSTGVISGLFVSQYYRGIFFNEDDVFSATINSGFTGGGGLKIKLSAY